jgi:diketogulonate reductase-like aldo/keto reductase
LLAQKLWIVPVPGTTETHRLEENVGAASVEPSKSELDEIQQELGGIHVQGSTVPRASAEDSGPLSWDREALVSKQTELQAFS